MRTIYALTVSVFLVLGGLTEYAWTDQAVTDPVKPQVTAEPSSPPSAWALSVRGGLAITSGSYSVPSGVASSARTSQHTGLTFGVYGERAFSDSWGLDFGLEYVRRGIDLVTSSGGVSNGTTSKLQWNALRIPIGAQYWPVPFFAVEAGPFIETAFGHVTGKVTANNVTSNVDASTGDAGLNSFGVGILGGIVGKLPVGDAWAAELHTRYLYDFTNTSSAAGSSLDLRQIQITAGVSHSL